MISDSYLLSDELPQIAVNLTVAIDDHDAIFINLFKNVNTNVPLIYLQILQYLTWTEEWQLHDFPLSMGKLNK